MASRIDQEDAIRLRFGGGVNSRASSDEINERECDTGSQNFRLDFGNTQFRNREFFDLAGTAPNGAEIRGFAQLQKRDGSITTLIQAGTQVYSTDFTSWTAVGTVSATANIRGPLDHNWLLDEIVIITDLSLVDPVYEWDGTTFSTMTHNLSGQFKAKYVRIQNERVHYANVESNSVATPHMIVGAAVSDHDNLSTSDRPSTAIGAADPWFLLTPDLRPINGIEHAFGTFIVSSENGELFNITGSNSQNFQIDDFYPRSAADGLEPMVFVGNDIVYGRQGRIESVVATEKFGDVETDDLSRWIQDQIEDYGDWTLVYNSRLQRFYALSSGTQELWSFQKAVLALNLSPWSKYTTQHVTNFSPTAIWSMLDPSDGLEYTFFGYSDGTVYRLEGSSAGDAGSTNVAVSRVSRLFSADLTAESYQFEGHLKYRANEAVTVTLTILYQGQNLFNESITLDLPAVEDGIYWNQTDAYWNETDNYWGSAFEGKLTRKPFVVPGASEDYQVKLEADGTAGFEINEVTLRYQSVSQTV